MKAMNSITINKSIDLLITQFKHNDNEEFSLKGYKY